MADTLILEEQSISGFTTDNASTQALVALVSGETYRVLWDGVEYICKAYTVNVPVDETTLPFVFIGNQAYVEWELGGGVGDMPNAVEPFAINQVPAEMADGIAGILAFSCAGQIAGTCESDSHMVEIYHVAEEDKEYLIWGSTLEGIANAIRTKTGEAGNIAVTDMAAKISEITGGGSGVEVVYVTFLSHDGATELHKRAVVPGNDCMEVVSGGVMDAPVRESSDTNRFTFAGWSLAMGGVAEETALDQVVEDRTVYAAYTASTRYYTVRFFDGDTLLNTMQVEYGAAANYTPEKEGYQFEGWSPSNTNITADTDCYAQWSTKLTFANATWEQIAEISESGEAANYFAVGDTKEVAYGDDVFTVAIAGFDHDDLADGSGKAGISIVCMSVPNYTTGWCTSYNSSRNYTYTNQYNAARNALNNTILPGLPSELQSVIKNVNKKTDASLNSGTNPTLHTTSQTLWLLSLDELGHSGAYYNPGSANYSTLGSKYDLFTTTDWSASSCNVPLPKVGSSDTKAAYWTRHLNRTGVNSVCSISFNTNGYSMPKTYSSDLLASTKLYLRFGFCV